MIRLRDEKTGKTKFMFMEWMDIERVLATAMPAWVAWAAVGFFALATAFATLR